MFIVHELFEIVEEIFRGNDFRVSKGIVFEWFSSPKNGKASPMIDKEGEEEEEEGEEEEERKKIFAFSTWDVFTLRNDTNWNSISTRIMTMTRKRRKRKMMQGDDARWWCYEDDAVENDAVEYEGREKMWKTWIKL